MNDPAVAEGIERADRVVESEEAVKLAKQYSMETRLLLEDPQPWAGEPEEDLTIADTLEILRYYLFPIAANVHGCYHAALDTDGYDEPDEISDIQSYANGSAKITLIILERTILGWTYLMNESNAELLGTVIQRLERIRDLLEIKFPNARDFIRPGFDEIEMAM